MSIFKRKPALTADSIKESLDNLPAGICFFDSNGFLKLCNKKMHKLSFDLSGHDVQYLKEFEDMLKNPGNQCTRPMDGKYYFMADGSVWMFGKKEIWGARGAKYTEYLASEVSEIYARMEELNYDNRKLLELSNEIKKMSANVLTIAREEETLSMKMRVHDEMGRSLIAARKLLKAGVLPERDEPVIEGWKRTIDVLKRSYDEPEKKDMLDELREACKGMLNISLKGVLPEKEEDAYLIVVATRECVTNAIRYAGATELYVDISHMEGKVVAKITNNGEPPKGWISEGGGLSSLRRKIERAGGLMEIRSQPIFELTVILPGRDELSRLI
jgi:signal transduction histidine kinase